MVSLFIDANTAVYFDSLGIEYIPQKVISKIKDKSITHNVFRIQYYSSIICRFYCITFTEYTAAGKTLLDYTELLCPNYYKKNGNIIYWYIKTKHGQEKLIFWL